MRRKGRKKILKVILGVLILFVALDLLLVGALFLPPIQQMVVNKVTASVSRKMSGDFSIEKVYLTPLFRVKAKKIVFKDHHNNDMIYVEALTGKIHLAKCSKNKLDFGTVSAQGADVVIRVYQGEKKSNISIWAKMLKSDKKRKIPFTISFEKLILQDSRLLVQNDKRWKNNGTDDMDYGYFELKELGADLDDFLVVKDDISCQINAIAFSQYSGFKMDKLKGDFRINREGLTIQNAKIITANSQLNCDFGFVYDSYKDYSSFVDSVVFNVNFKTSSLDFKDIQCFAPSLKGMDNHILMQGRMYGPLRDFSLEKMQIQYGLQSHISGNFAFKDIIHFKKALFNVDIENSQIDMNDLVNFKLPQGNVLQLPEMARNLGKVDLDLQFAGLLSHFQTDLLAETKLGNLTVKLNAFPEQQRTRFAGNFSSQSFDLGQLLKQKPLLGKTSLSLSITGNSGILGVSDDFLSTVEASVNGKIARLDLCNYPIQNMVLQGSIRQKTYTVNLQLNDKNIALNLGGVVYFSQMVPTYHASLSLKNFAVGELFSYYPQNIDTAKASKLEKLVLLARKFPAFNIQFDTLDMDISGDKLDDLFGYFRVDKISVQNDSNSTFCDWIRLVLPPSSSEEHRFFLTSSFLNVNLETNYPYKSIKDSLYNIVAYYFPQFFERKINTKQVAPTPNDYYFNLAVKTFFAKDILNFINPALHLAREAEVKISLAKNRSKDAFYVNIPYLKIDNKLKINKLLVDAKTGDQDTFYVDLSGDSLALFQKNNRLVFHDIDLQTSIKGDFVNYDLHWISPESIAIAEENNIKGWLKGYYQNGVSVKILDSKLYLKDSPLYFTGNNLLVFKDQKIKIDDCQMEGDVGKIALNGTYSKVSNEVLEADLYNVDMSLINNILVSKKISFDGLLSAQIVLKMEENNKSMLLGKTYISDFTFNDVLFGDIFLLASGASSEMPMFTGGVFSSENSSGIVNLKDYNYQKFSQEPRKRANLTGFFDPKRKEFRVNASIDTLEIGFLSPFLASFSNDISGIASGNLSFVYNPDSLFFFGDVNVKQGFLNIAPLNTTYELRNQIITFNDRGIEFHKILLYDKFNNTAFLDGSVYHNHFKDFKIDLAIETNRLLVLNTVKTADSYFCGDGFVSGKVNIKGDTKKLSFFGDNLKTLKDTKMIFPVSSTSKTSDNKGIKFTIPANIVSPQPETRKNQTEMDFDFTLEVTKDADVRVDLDLIDGALNCITNGSLRLTYNSHNKPLTLDGALTILNGKFNMSLKNLLPREFDIVEGGTISFFGPFSKSAVSISALYSKNISVNTISNQLSIGRTQVDAYLNLSGLLKNPGTSFAFSFPKLSAEEQLEVFGALDTTNQQNVLRQFFSVVFFNTFLAGDLSGTSLESQGIGSGIDMLAGMINGVLSQQLDFLDIGIDYYANENQYREYSINAAIPLYNDRIMVKTRFGVAENVSGTSSAENSFVGNVSVEYKINEEGNWIGRFFYFNDEYEVNYDASRPQQGGGVALLFQQDFNSKVNYVKKGQMMGVEPKKRKNKKP